MPQNKISKEELDDIKRELQQYNIEDNTDIWFNSQEKKAYDHGYIEKHFQNYLSAKRRLRQAIIKAADDDNKKMLLNAARIYSYTLFENTWFGYLTAYADCQISAFEFKDEKPVIFTNAYRNHLPSFSSAILHFGTCRDLFSPLLKILVYLQEGKGFKNFNKEFLKIKYDWFQKFKESPLRFRLMEELEGFLEKNNVKITKSITSELEKILNDNNIKESHNFEYDLKLLLNNCNLDQKEYLSKGKDFFDSNKFRNTFAHNIRMLWWKNKELWGFSNEDYENMRHGKKEFHDVLIDIFRNHRHYEETIEGLDPSNFVHSAKILQETHDTIATFLNGTFALILPEKPTD